MMSILAAMSWVAATLFVCFKTTAVYEYFRLLVPPVITKMPEYDSERKYDYGLSYKLYMMTRHDSFLTRLVTCPYCLGAWLSAGFSWYFSCMEWLPVVYLGGLTSYMAVSIAISKLEVLEASDGN